MKVAVVTGAARGIGLATARRFICTQVFAPAMLRGGGAVVNASPTAASTPRESG